MSSAEKIIAKGVSSHELEKAKKQLLVLSQEHLSTLVGAISDLAAGVPITDTRPGNGGFENLLISLSAYSLAQLFQLKSGAENILSHVAVEEESESGINQFGLPVNWAAKKSVEAINIFRGVVESGGDKAAIYAAARDFLSRIKKEYARYRVVDVDYFDRVMTAGGEIPFVYLQHERGNRLLFLEKKYIGYPIQQLKFAKTQYLKWELIMDNELWAIKNHGQSLLRMAQRGGASPAEIVSILYAIPMNDPQFPKISDEGLLQWFQENNMLVDVQ